MSVPRSLRALAVTTLVVTASLTTVASSSPSTAARPDATQRVAAEQSLRTVQRLFSPRDQAHGRDVTMALRELAVRKNDLSEGDREIADSYFKRPTDASNGDRGYSTAEETPVCDADLCVHYVADGGDAPDLTDVEDAAGSAGVNNVPDYVDLTLREMAFIHDTYLEAGYREPRPDGTAGGSNLIDIYLQDIGADGTYGYCTTDDPEQDDRYDVSAYCVLDNDYAEFTENTPVESLQVTAAHEYFHATQYAYDWLEDSWLLEATAAWIEDEMYPDVNDNLQYLNGSPLSDPGVSMDQFIDAGRLDGWHYGVWSFFRYLTERYTTEQGGLPTLVRDIFLKVDGASGAPDQYSLEAVAGVLAARGTSLAAMYTSFAAANRRPGTTYAEGYDLAYPVGALAGNYKMKNGNAKRVSTTLDHLASQTYRFTVKGLASSTRLRLVLDMAPTAQGSAAVVTNYLKAGGAAVQVLKLNANGDVTRTLPFGKFKYVEVTLVNASGRYTACFDGYRGGNFSCQGKPVDDRRPIRLTAQAVR